MVGRRDDERARARGHGAQREHPVHGGVEDAERPGDVQQVITAVAARDDRTLIRPRQP
jgi:hypothetical protein